MKKLREREKVTTILNSNSHSYFCLVWILLYIHILNIFKKLKFKWIKYTSKLNQYIATLYTLLVSGFLCSSYEISSMLLPVLCIYSVGGEEEISFSSFFFFSSIFISWRLITSQHFRGFCHTLTWISHGVTCVPHPDPTSHLPLHLIPLGLPSAPGPSTCLMHPAWAGDLFHYR